MICNHCYKEVNYIQGFAREKDVNVNDLTLDYDKYICRCTECGNEIDSPEIYEINEKIKQLVYERMKHKIPLPESYEERLNEILNEMSIL